MNPFQILNIAPTKDKMAIRRAYVDMCKTHHPDQGGDAVRLQQVQTAYNTLISNNVETDIIETEVSLNLIDFLYGCQATVVIRKGIFKGTEIEFIVPQYTYPGAVIEFNDVSTSRLVRVKLNEIKTNEYARFDANIVIRHTINMLEAELGKTVEVTNFDQVKYEIKVSPETTADRLLYTFDGGGFYNKKARIRGNLTVIVEVDRKRYIDV